jgi:excisionase family DNA binding protein
MSDPDTSFIRVVTRIRDAVDDYLHRHPHSKPQPSATTPPASAPREPLNPMASTSLTRAIWLTVEQAVRYLGLPSRKALYQAIRRGHVPVHRMGRALRFFRAELDEALTRR